MSVWALALIVLGACTATSWIFRLIDRIEGR